MNKESKKVSGPAVEAGVWRLRLYMCTVAGAGQTLETSASGQGGGEARVMRVRGWTLATVWRLYD